MIPHCCECPVLQAEREAFHSIGVPAGCSLSETSWREHFARSRFPSSPQIQLSRSRQHDCPVLSCSRPQDGLLEELIFTDGSSHDRRVPLSATRATHLSNDGHVSSPIGGLCGRPMIWINESSVSLLTWRISVGAMWAGARHRRRRSSRAWQFVRH